VHKNEVIPALQARQDAAAAAADAEAAADADCGTITAGEGLEESVEYTAADKPAPSCGGVVRTLSGASTSSDASDTTILGSDAVGGAMEDEDWGLEAEEEGREAAIASSPPRGFLERLPHHRDAPRHDSPAAATAGVGGMVDN
jgi:hypothetical protein